LSADPEGPSAQIGLDEAGKGDYFGPLVVAAVCGSPSQLSALGVADSKKVADRRCQVLAAQVRASFPVEVVVVNPARYNELYSQMKNLNRLLAWAHARALENLLARVGSVTVRADQFADASVLERALLERGAQATLIQEHRAEIHPAVAAASLVARAEFLTRLAELGKRFACELPKGAGPPVDQAGREAYRKGGVELLRQIAKLHFKTSQKIGVPASQLV
jgi:ribonuclease HIII